MTGDQDDHSPHGSKAALESRLAAVEAELEALKGRVAQPSPQQDKVCMVVYSGSLDRILAAFTIATGAAAMGTEVQLFFTFWGTAALRKVSSSRPRPFLDRLFGWMLPAGRNKLKLSTLHMGGLGTRMIKTRMQSKKFASIDDLFQMAEDAGVRISVCDMSMDLLGIGMDDLIDYPEMDRCGVATFLSHAMDSSVCLFI